MTFNGPYGNIDDAFETYIDMDFFRDNKAEDGGPNNNEMPSPNLFQYLFDGKLEKDEENDEASSPSNVTYQNPPLVPNSYNLISNPPAIVNEDRTKLATSVQTIDDIKLLTQTQQQQHPELITTDTSVESSVSILNAQLADLLSKLQGIKQENLTDNKASSNTAATNIDTSTTTSNKPISRPTASTKSSSTVNDGQVQTDDDNQLDIKKLSSKERRQIRNKISARNFRVRRKEYIQNLESIKNQQEKEIGVLKQALLHLQEENTQLKQEVKELHKLNQPNKLHTASSPPHNSATVAPADFNGITTKFKRSSSPLLPQQPVSPASRYLVIPNVNKDAPPSSASSSSGATNQNIWQDSSRVRQTISV